MQHRPPSPTPLRTARGDRPPNSRPSMRPTTAAARPLGSYTIAYQTGPSKTTHSWPPWPIPRSG